MRALVEQTYEKAYEKTMMHSAVTNKTTTECLDFPDVGRALGPAKPATTAIRRAMKLVVLSALLLIITAARLAQAQTETVLYNFCSQPSCSDGSLSASSLTSDGTGNFYGTTAQGGTYGQGTVFELSPNGSEGWNETVLYSFCSVMAPDGQCLDGAFPLFSHLIFDSVGNLYGTTYYGGADGRGVVFELDLAGGNWTETVLHAFSGPDGAYPASGLIFDTEGNLYGTTGGGAGYDGNVFELSLSGGNWTEQVLYTESDGGYAGITMDADGNIFGAGTSEVFELSPNGAGSWSSTVLHTFIGAPNDGSDAYGTPVLDQAGNLYGTTWQGGARNVGTVYKLTPITKGKNKGTWTEKILHSFTTLRGKAGKDGSQPAAAVLLDAAGNIYSTTEYGGRYGDGTVFELVAPVGSGRYEEQVLWSFNGTDGFAPSSCLIWDSAGNLYGTTWQGGPGGMYGGVVFEVTR